MAKVVINVVGGVVQEVISDDKEIEVYLVDFDMDDSKELSEKYVDLLNDPNFELKELKEL
jgi:hypothetical protein